MFSELQKVPIQRNQEFEQQETTMILMSLTIFNSLHAALCLPIFALAGKIQRKII
jgi:hypothetical protein